jgi:hypothetical protein
MRNPCSKELWLQCYGCWIKYCDVSLDIPLYVDKGEIVVEYFSFQNRKKFIPKPITLVP